MLCIKDVFGEDADEYSVKVFNKGGSKVSRANLNIRGKPKTPSMTCYSVCLCTVNHVLVMIPSFLCKFTRWP